MRSRSTRHAFALSIALVGAAVELGAPREALAEPKAGAQVAQAKSAGGKVAKATASTQPAPAASDAKKTDPAPAAPRPDGFAEPIAVEPARAIYLAGDVAFARMDLGGLSDSLGFDHTGANGFEWTVSVGLKWKAMRYGLRFGDTSTTQFSMWKALAEVGYTLSPRPLAPTVTGHVGWTFDQEIQPGAFQSSLPTGTVLAPNVDVSGPLVGVELGADYYAVPSARIGPYVGFDALFLHRPQAAHPMTLFPASSEALDKPLYTGSGSGIGYALTIGARGGFDIGF